MAKSRHLCFQIPAKAIITVAVIALIFRNPLVAALDRWVDGGVAPAKIIATRYVDNNPVKGVEMTRPLYPPALPSTNRTAVSHGTVNHD